MVENHECVPTRYTCILQTMNFDAILISDKKNRENLVRHHVDCVQTLEVKIDFSHIGVGRGGSRPII